MDALPAVLVFVGFALLFVAPYVVTGWRQDRHARIIARQIALTDAIHAELGAAAAPLVTKSAFGRWRVTYTLPSGRAPIERLIAITRTVLDRWGVAEVEIVFTPPRAPRLRAA